MKKIIFININLNINSHVVVTNEVSIMSRTVLRSQNISRQILANYLSRVIHLNLYFIMYIYEKSQKLETCEKLSTELKFKLKLFY